MHFYCVSFVIGFVPFIPNLNATQQLFSKTTWENDLVLDAFNQKPNRSVVVALLPLRLSFCKLASVAEGTTKENLLKTLEFDDKKVRNYYLSLKDMLNDFKRRDLILVNKIYVNYSSEVDTKFLANSSFQYGVDTVSIGFNMPRSAHSFINNHVATATYRRIVNILKEGDITPQTNMMMITAANLKTTWENPFNIIKSINRKFYHLDNRVTEIPMMVQEDHYEQYENKQFKMLKLMLRNYGGIFTIVLPSLTEGLPRLLSSLKVDADLINRCRQDVKRKFTKLVMPRFKIKTYLDLTEHFQNSTIKDILNSSSSDLNNILKEKFRGKRNMFIGKIKQNLFLEVDEFGSIRKPLRSGFDDYDPTKKWRKPSEFAADRPFYFTLELDVNSSRHPLFHGVYYGPV